MPNVPRASRPHRQDIALLAFPAKTRAPSLFDGLRSAWDSLQRGLAWIEEHEADIRAWGRDIEQRGGPDDAWRYLFSKVDGVTSISMKMALELERRLSPANRGEALTLLLGDAVRDQELLNELERRLRESAAISYAHREQLLHGLALCGSERDILAVPLLINVIEGLFWRDAADAGLIERNKSGKWLCTSRTGSPGTAMHGLERVLDLPELALGDAFRAFVKAVVYGGAGNPFRHGTATRGWHLRASFLVVALMGWLETRGQLDVSSELRAALERVRERQRAMSARSLA